MTDIRPPQRLCAIGDTTPYSQFLNGFVAIMFTARPSGKWSMLARSSESRRSARQWMQRRAQIAFKDRDQPVPCVIQDMSDGGARLRLEPPAAELPHIFTLVLFKDSVQRNCRVVWTKGDFVGVKFVSEWFGAKLSEPPAKPIRFSA